MIEAKAENTKGNQIQVFVDKFNSYPQARILIRAFRELSNSGWQFTPPGDLSTQVRDPHTVENHRLVLQEIGQDLTLKAYLNSLGSPIQDEPDLAFTSTLGFEEKPTGIKMHLKKQDRLKKSDGLWLSDLIDLVDLKAYEEAEALKIAYGKPNRRRALTALLGLAAGTGLGLLLGGLAASLTEKTQGRKPELTLRKGTVSNEFAHTYNQEFERVVKELQEQDATFIKNLDNGHFGYNFTSDDINYSLIYSDNTLNTNTDPITLKAGYKMVIIKNPPFTTSYIVEGNQIFKTVKKANVNSVVEASNVPKEEKIVPLQNELGEKFSNLIVEFQKWKAAKSKPDSFGN